MILFFLWCLQPSWTWTKALLQFSVLPIPRKSIPTEWGLNSTRFQEITDEGYIYIYIYWWFPLHTVDGSEMRLTTWDVWNPVNNGIFTISTGFSRISEPSTVVPAICILWAFWSCWHPGSFFRPIGMQRPRVPGACFFVGQLEKHLLNNTVSSISTVLIP